MITVEYVENQDLRQTLDMKSSFPTLKFMLCELYA